MQYILTEEEYNELRNRKIEQTKKFKEDLLKLCQLAAKNVPIIIPWDKTKTPTIWGCILDNEENYSYCDCCPSQNLCPYDAKEYSK